MTPHDKLSEFYALFVAGVKSPGDEDDLSNGVACIIGKIKTAEDALVACSAIMAYQHDMPINTVHPHSEGGRDLHDIISMFVWLAFQQKVGDGIEPPEWIDEPEFEEI